MRVDNCKIVVFLGTERNSGNLFLLLYLMFAMLLLCVVVVFLLCWCSIVCLLAFSSGGVLFCCVIWMSYVHTLPARDLAPEAHGCRNVLECS